MSRLQLVGALALCGVPVLPATGQGTQLSAEVLAGTGQVGFQDGLASQATFSGRITALVVDSAGNVILSDADNCRIRRVGVDGLVSTLVAGLASYTNGVGEKPKLGEPRGLALGLDGSLYASDSQDVLSLISPDPPLYAATESWNRLVKLESSGEVSVEKTWAVNSGGDGNRYVGSIASPTLGRVGLLFTRVNRASWSEAWEVTSEGSEKSLYISPVTRPDTTMAYSLTGTRSGDYLFFQYESKTGKYSIRKLASSGAQTILYEGVEVLRAVTVGPNNEIYAVVGGSPISTTVARVTGSSALQTVYSSPGLGIALAADVNGAVYLMQDNRLVKLAYPALGCVVQTSSSGGGTMSISPAQDAYPTNSEVTLTAAPLPGWQFLGWSGSITGDVSPLTLTLQSNVTIQANFVAPLTLTGAHVSFSRTPDASAYPYGSLVQFTATPDPQYVWRGWTDGVMDLTRAVTITGPVALAANAETDLRFGPLVLADPDLARMTLEGTAGRSVQVLYSDDLQTWTPYVILQLPAERKVEFAVQRETHPRFYRAQFLP